MRKYKKFISFLLILGIILPIIPIGEIVSFGASGVSLNSLNINYKYADGEIEDLELISFYFSVSSNAKESYTVRARYDNGEEATIGTFAIRELNESGIGYANPSFQVKPKANVRVTNIYIGGAAFDVNKEIPMITGIESYTVLPGENLSIIGQNFKGHDPSVNGVVMNTVENTGSKYVGNIASGSSGNKNIDFKVVDGNIVQQITYPGAFKLMGKLDELGTEDLEIIPSTGEVDSVAYIKTTGAFNSKSGEAEYSVFFLKDKTDKYTKENMAEIISVSQSKKVLKIKVPKGLDDSTEYLVQVTNKVRNVNSNIDRQVVQRKDVVPKYFVIGADTSPKITSIDPVEGPDTGEVVEVIGRQFEELTFISEINLPEGETGTGLVGENSVTKVKKTMSGTVSDIIDSEGITPNNKEDDVIEIDYDIVGKNIQYDKENVTSIKRYISTYIGDRTSPYLENGKVKYKFTEVYDNIWVEVPKATVTSPKEVNVIMVVQTEIVANGQTYTHVSVVNNEGVKYTIKPSSTRPTITKINPDKIEVVGDDKYNLKEDIVVGIEGKDFKVIRFKDKLTGKTNTHYPMVGIGADITGSNKGIVLRMSKDKEGQVEIFRNGNWEPAEGVNMRVLDSKGNILDGSPGKDTGSRIVVDLPKTLQIDIPKAEVTIDPTNPQLKDVVVRNPVLGTDSFGEKAINEGVMMQFVSILRGQPNIDTVIPNVMAIDAGEKIQVVGSNFDEGVRVYIGGVEAKGVRRILAPNGNDWILEFNSPKFPEIVEGATKIIVVNRDGGMASRDFTYVKSLGEMPKLKDFTPKSGTEGTLMVIDGENFFAPDPAVSNISGANIYKLLGTRVLLDGVDVNEYNKSGNNIKLIDYSSDSDDRVIRVESGMAVLSDYYHSVVFKDKEDKYYTLSYDEAYNIILKTPNSGVSGGQYKVFFTNGKLVAEERGTQHPLIVTQNGLKLDGKELTMKTAYKVEDNKIVGSKVKILNSGRIEVTIPKKDSKLPDGYIVTVENPDTNKSSSKDKFYYFGEVNNPPKIDKIKPSVGTVEGGYEVLIEGSGFEDTSKVYIDGVLLPANAVVRRNIDGKDHLVISTMPAYKKPMVDTSRVIVPVVVENGNGGTATGRFTYVIPPTQRPNITSAEFQKEGKDGNAAGGEILTIAGRYFRYNEQKDTYPKYIGWKQGTDENGKPIYYEDIDGNNKYTFYNTQRDYKEKNGEAKELNPTVDNYDEYFVSPVLPKVQIGGVDAKIVEFNINEIKVITPQLPAGRHDVRVINNDYGTSNSLPLNFTASKINIGNIVPDTGNKAGKEDVEIYGSGFQNTEIKVVSKEGNTTKVENKTMPLVRFGNVGGTKPINNYRANIFLENDNFKLSYNHTDAPKRVVDIEYTFGEVGNKKKYTGSFDIPQEAGAVFYIALDDLVDDKGNKSPAYELVKVVVDGAGRNENLIVEKGYSPDMKLDGPSRIVGKTPSAYSIGRVRVEVSNPDGGKANTNYTYTNPDSRPRIINITSDGVDPKEANEGKDMIISVDYKGGQIIEIFGEDFIEPMEVTIGNAAKITDGITYRLGDDPQSIDFKMPPVNESHVGKMYRVSIKNRDGGNTHSEKTDNKWNKPIYIMFTKGDTDPSASNISPDKGPTTGGTKVIIKGSDFRADVASGKYPTVSFGGTQVEVNKVKYIDRETLEVIVPASKRWGLVDVVVRNYDGSSAGNLKFTYITKPKIDDMNPKKIYKNDEETVVEIKGSQFMQGARVIVGGKLLPVKDLTPDMKLTAKGLYGVDKDGKNIEMAIVGGVDAKSVKVENENLIKVNFKETLDLENTSILILNPDTGLSDPYNEFRYEDPIPLRPLVLEGIPGYEGTVALVWSKSDPNLLNKATEFEIYGREISNSNNTFIANTTDHEYLVKGLKPNTEYEFLVRAINQYGAAIDFAKVKVKTLSLQDDYKEKEKQKELDKLLKEVEEKGKETIAGNKATLVLGKESMKKPVDLSLTKYKNVKHFEIKVPLGLARQDFILNIKDNMMNLNINPRDLYTYKVSTLDKGNKDAYMVIQIGKERLTNIPRNKRVAGEEYGFIFNFQTGTDKTEIDKMLRPASLSLKVDTVLYPNPKNPKIHKFNPGKGSFEPVGQGVVSIDTKGKYIILSDR